MLLTIFSLLQLSLSPAELLSLHQKAEMALKQKEYAVAADHYKEILPYLEKVRTRDWHTYVDATIRYAEALFALSKEQEAEAILNYVLTQMPPDELAYTIQLAKIRRYKGSEGLVRAYQEMQAIDEKWPCSAWNATLRLYFHSLEMMLDHRYDQLMQKAERLARASLRKEALLLYHEIENAIEKKVYPKANQDNHLLLQKVRYHLAALHYELAEQEQTIHTSFDAKAYEDKTDCTLLYLAARAHEKRLEYKEALSLLQTIENKESCQALYELGRLYYKAGNLASAKQQLQKARGDSKFALLARTLLAQIEIEEGAYEQAEKSLALLLQYPVPRETFGGKIALLQGELALQAEEYRKAIPYFKKALQKNRAHKESIILSLVYCYLALHEELEEAERLFSLLQKNEELFPWKSSLLLAQGKVEEAFSLIPPSHTEPLTLLLLTTLYIEKQEWQKAIDSLTQGAHLERPSHRLSALLQARVAHHLSLLKEEEQAYLKALFAAYCKREEASTLLLPFLEGAHKEEVLYLMATLAYQNGEYAEAHKLFLQLSQQKGSFVEAALYGAAESAFQLDGHSAEAVAYRKQLLEEYPETLFGAESYFKKYPIEAYLKGAPEALAHLQPFTTLYPHSSLTLAASFFLALHETEIETKRNHLCHALAAFQEIPTARKERGVNYFRIEALLALARTYTDVPDQLITLLKPLVAELQKEKKEEKVVRWLYEAEWLLARAYIATQKFHTGQNLLFSLMRSYAASGQTKGLFLALAWQEQGDLAFAQNEYSLALESYEFSLQSGEGFLTEAQKIDLWLKQSDCRLKLRKKLA